MPPPSLHLPVWPFWLAGAACEAICAPFGIEPPLYRRRVDFFTKSRAFDISRARAELGYAPPVDLREGIRRRLPGTESRLDLHCSLWLHSTIASQKSAVIREVRGRAPTGTRPESRSQLFAAVARSPRD